MSRKSSPSYSRSYLFKVDMRCNAGKLEKLDAMQAEWSRLLPIVGQHCWHRFLTNQQTKTSLSSAVGTASVFGDTPLVTSMRQCMAVAVEGLIKSWKTNTQNRLKKALMRSRKFEDGQYAQLQHQLLWINSNQLWLVPHSEQLVYLANSQGKTALSHLDKHASRIMRLGMQLFVRKFKTPTFDNLPMQVNQMSSCWAKPNKSQDEGIDHWLRLSTLERQKRIELPIRKNSYANRFQGTQALTFSLVKKENGWLVKVCKSFASPAKRSTKDPKNVLGIDMGMRNLLATSQGAIFGQGFGTALRAWDAALQRIQTGLQGAGHVKLGQCKRYRDHVHRMRCWMTSTIRQAVKRALALGQPHTVVIEALNFHSQEGTLSKKMNRLVRLMGTGIVTQTLECKAQEQGFALVRVNPAYTSQECHSCDFIARKNRKGDVFRCVCCGKQAHADAHASRNLVKRFHAGRVCEFLRYDKLGMQGLDLWAARMRARWEKATPGTLALAGVFGHVRAGLQNLDPSRANMPSMRELANLLNGNRRGTISTRESE